MKADLEIVIAEDNLIQRTYMMQVIESLGFRTLPAANGAEALNLLQRTGAQILITDYLMPRLNGSN